MIAAPHTSQDATRDASRATTSDQVQGRDARCVASVGIFSCNPSEVPAPRETWHYRLEISFTNLENLNTMCKLSVLKILSEIDSHPYLNQFFQEKY